MRSRPRPPRGNAWLPAEPRGLRRSLIGDAYKLNIYKLNTYKLNTYKLNTYKLNTYKLNTYKLNTYKLNTYKLNTHKLDTCQRRGGVGVPTPPEPLSEADLDLLADYSLGLLDDAEAARVANLIASDEQWALTHQLLTASTPKLDRALNAYSEAAPALPAEVLRAIDAALDDLRTDRTDRTENSRLASLDAARERRSARSTRAKSINSWVRVSAAAAVVVAIVFGLSSLGLHLGTSKSASSNAVRGPEATGAAPAPDLAHGGISVTQSGTEYTKTTLGSRVRNPGAIPSYGGPKSTSSSSVPAPPVGAVDPDLGRLAAEPALSDCLSAVEAAHGGTVTAIDYAKYEGKPALVVTLTNPDLRVAVGAACGLPNSGADEIATAATR